jgi:hypothetical protein
MNEIKGAVKGKRSCVKEKQSKKEKTVRKRKEQDILKI